MVCDKHIDARLRSKRNLIQCTDQTAKRLDLNQLLVGVVRKLGGASGYPQVGGRCPVQEIGDCMENLFLNYRALGLLFFVVIVLVYGITSVPVLCSWPAAIDRFSGDCRVPPFGRKAAEHDGWPVENPR
jgi:hypothetical protein